MIARKKLLTLAWGLLAASAAIVWLAPAPKPSAANQGRVPGDDGFRVLRLNPNIGSLAKTQLSDVQRLNPWGEQATVSPLPDESAKRWRLAGIGGEATARTVLIQLADGKIVPLRVGDQFPDGTPIMDIKDNGVCVQLDGAKRLLPLPGQTPPLKW